MKISLSHDQVADVYRDLQKTPQSGLKHLSLEERSVCKKIAEYMKKDDAGPLKLQVGADFNLDNIKNKIAERSQPAPAPSNAFQRLGKGIANVFGRVSSHSLYKALHPDAVASKKIEKQDPMHNQMKDFIEKLPLNPEFKNQVLQLSTFQQAKVLRDILQDVILSKGPIPKDSVNSLKFAHEALCLLNTYALDKSAPVSPEHIALRMTCENVKTQITSYLIANYPSSCKKIEENFIRNASEFFDDITEIKLENYEEYIRPTVEVVLKQEPQKANQPLQLPEFKINLANVNGDIKGFVYESTTHPFNKDELVQALKKHTVVNIDTNDEDLMRRVEDYLTRSDTEKRFYEGKEHTDEHWKTTKAELTNRIKSNSPLDLTTLNILMHAMSVNAQRISQDEIIIQNFFSKVKVIAIKHTPNYSDFQVGQSKLSLLAKNLTDPNFRLALEPQHTV